MTRDDSSIASRYAPLRGFTLAVTCAIALASYGCQTAPPQIRQTGETQAGPSPLREPSSEAERFVIDPDDSELRLLVYREGSLAELGHNHVIVGNPRGEIFLASTSAESGFRLCVAVESFRVDEQEARGQEGADFAAPVPQAARTATRKNMLGEQLLNGSLYPAIEMLSERLSGPLWNPDITARIDLGGVNRLLTFPAAVVRSNGQVVVIARSSVLQTDFGMEPFSVLGGALRVKDRIEVRVRIVARQAGTALGDHPRFAPCPGAERGA